MIRDFRRNTPLQVLIVCLLILWVMTAIQPFNRRDWLLENILVFIYCALLVITYKRFSFSNISYMLFGLFIGLHLIGAHYTYSEMPVGFWLQTTFDLSRNHYDRVVHLSYGLLCAYPFREIFIRSAGVRVSWSYIMPVIGVLAFSGFYEMLEAIVAAVVSPELGDAYLGTQGDIWDAEKDAFLAFLGAVISMSVVWFYNKRNKNSAI